MSKAYNEWMFHFCKTDSRRLKFVALLAAQDPKAAAEELTRAVTKRGAVAGVLPTFIPQRPDFGDSWYDPIYAAAEQLGVGLGFHTGTSADSLGGQRFRKFLSAHTIDHPAEQMMAMIATIVGGVFERFPKLSIAYLESGIGWVPYMPVKTGIQQSLKEPGFRVALAIVSLPGMTMHFVALGFSD